jgi:hypothetical protein
VDSHKLSTLVYAEGQIEDFIEIVTKPKEGDDEKTLTINQHHEEILLMWSIVAAGLRQLRSENTDLLNKLALVKMTIDQ